MISNTKSIILCTLDNLRYMHQNVLKKTLIEKLLHLCKCELKTYVGKSKINSVKSLPAVGIEPMTLGSLVLHSHAFLTKLTWNWLYVKLRLFISSCSNTMVISAQSSKFKDQLVHKHFSEVKYPSNTCQASIVKKVRECNMRGLRNPGHY